MTSPEALVTDSPSTGTVDVASESSFRNRMVAGCSWRTKLGAIGEYYSAFLVMGERVTKWPAPRNEVEYDVLRVSANVHTN